MPDLPLTVTVGALLQNQSYTPQEFADAIAARLRISTAQAYSLFTSGAVLPASDTGPHFLTTESTWYYFDYNVGSYQPIRLNSKSLRYIISNTEPNPDDYDIWYRVAADGTPLDIRKYQGGQWTAFPTDYDNITNKPNLAPIGEIIMFGSSTPPQDFLACNGQAVLRGQYAELFAVIGTSWGSGDGVTTFNVPDLRGRTPVGIGTSPDTDANPTAWSVAQKKGAETVELTEAEIPEHEHLIANSSVVDGSAADVSSSNHLAYINESGVDNAYRLKGTGSTPTRGKTSTYGSGDAHNNLQPSIGMPFMIRYQN